MAASRVRYDGPGRSTTVVHHESGYSTTVKVGHQLPTDAPASLRDELAKRDNWTEIASTSSSGSAKSSKDGDA